MEGVSSEKQEFRIRDSGRCILGAGGSDKKTGPLSVESPRIKDLIKIANASINKFFFEVIVKVTYIFLVKDLDAQT